MSTTIFDHVKGRDLPDLMKENADPDSLFRVVLERIGEPEEALPDEENFKPEFVEEIQRRDKEYNKSDSIVCHTKEESDALLKKSWNEND